MFKFTWEETLTDLKYIASEMDQIHENYAGKEHKEKRDELLKPWRERCVQMGNIRYSILRK